MSANVNVKKLLVLTSATGAGHDTHAAATAAWCARLFGPGVEVTVAHELEDSHVFYRGAVEFYNLIQRRAPWFHHVYYNTIELLDLLNPGTVSLGRAHYIELLQRVRPDAILSVHDCLNRGYFELAKEVLGPETLCATYCPEFEGGYGFSRNWVNPRGDFYFARTAETAREAIRRGVPHERALVAGHWAPPAFYEPPGPRTTGCFNLLLSTGGNGAQNHRRIIEALQPFAGRLEITALCGRDARARDELEAWAQQRSAVPVRALGFTHEMPALLRSASAVLARGGATTAGEALLCSCPVIFNGLGGMMPQELPTLRYFRRREMGRYALTGRGVAHHVREWLDRPEDHARDRERMRLACDEVTPRKALERLLRIPPAV
jgi:processive 1,2-diacylglycerol beta-glucosyltransferase